jgi:hypothetical protein
VKQPSVVPRIINVSERVTEDDVNTKEDGSTARSLVKIVPAFGVHLNCLRDSVTVADDGGYDPRETVNTFSGRLFSGKYWTMLFGMFPIRTSLQHAVVTVVFEARASERLIGCVEKSSEKQYTLYFVAGSKPVSCRETFL